VIPALGLLFVLLLPALTLVLGVQMLPFLAIPPLILIPGLMWRDDGRPTGGPDSGGPESDGPDSGGGPGGGPGRPAALVCATTTGPLEPGRVASVPNRPPLRAGRPGPAGDCPPELGTGTSGPRRGLIVGEHVSSGRPARFARALDSQHLHVVARPGGGDPVNDALEAGPVRLGLLALDAGGGLSPTVPHAQFGVDPLLFNDPMPSEPSSAALALSGAGAGAWESRTKWAVRSRWYPWT
jgi:hypothetical protein